MVERDAITAALRRGGIVDITTTGRRSGRPRRIEIACFNLDGRLFISGLPGRRAWLANLTADPRLVLHLKRGIEADVPAQARIITADAERRPLLESICRTWGRLEQLEVFVRAAPLIEVIPDDATLLEE